MGTEQHGPDDGIGRLLSELPRHDPPETPLAAILERWQIRRRNALTFVGLGIAAGLLALFLVRPAPVDPPVHLRLRIVDASRLQPVDQTPGLPPEDVPTEIQGP